MSIFYSIVHISSLEKQSHSAIYIIRLPLYIPYCQLTKQTWSSDKQENVNKARGIGIWDAHGVCSIHVRVILNDYIAPIDYKL